MQNSLQVCILNCARVLPPASFGPRRPRAALPAPARGHGRPVRSRRRRPVHSLVPQSHSLVSIVQLACSLLWCEIASRARRWPARWHRRSAVVAVRFSPVQCRSARGCARERGWPNVVAHRGCPVRAGVDALLLLTALIAALIVASCAPHGIESQTIAQLREHCRALGIRGFAQKNKAELVQLIQARAPAGGSMPACHACRCLHACRWVSPSGPYNLHHACADDGIPVADDDDGLEAMSFGELQQRCRELSIKGYSHKSKAVMMQLIRRPH